ncbi:hypothetical protein F2P56_010267 [Juglans regia]|uniref:5'-adenylylsulfate reductase-like 7 n=1 Tax=Juglans regia TaxID=51240 RepID=A0A833XY06_JUGRE|nr:hypothetical protein F2P56_010267 [Juglans regia]
MAVASLVFLYITLFAWLRLASSSSVLCPKESNFFLYGLQSQCPLSISPNPPLQVDGDFLDRALASKGRNGYTSVLFYASRCPFSCSVLPAYKTLSSMFPQIEHLTVEKSSAMPRCDATCLTCFFNVFILGLKNGSATMKQMYLVKDWLSFMCWA